MEISGFKSFSDRTEIQFPGGITAVVGPNGCGKSNIGDAINWVLGEQSPRMLRGKHMADVIFAGSEGRKPVGLAEVSLHLRGAVGQAAVDDLLVVTRRLFRSGESEYLVNGRRSRLKDIQDLLEQGHVGARTYATIEQGRIDQILNAKPKDRRLLIEDAAGIAGYKHKRRLTEMKLEATQANLLRVHDIIVEVERQTRSLKRQAALARRYRRLRDELRSAERTQFAARSLALDADLAATRDVAGRAGEAEAAAAAALGRIERRLVDERAAIEAQNRSLRESANELHRVQLAIDRGEAQVRSCAERITEASETESKQSALGRELGERVAEQSRETAEHEAVVVALAGEVREVRARVAEQQGRVDDAAELRRRLRDELEGLRREQFELVAHAAEWRNRLRATADELERVTAQVRRLEAERSATSADLSRLAGEQVDLDEQCARCRAEVERLVGAVAASEVLLAGLRRAQAEGVEALSRARESEQSASARLATLEDVGTRFAGVSDGVRTLLGSVGAAGVGAAGVVADFIEAAAEVEGAAEGYLAAFLPTVILESDDDVCRAAELLRAEGAGRTSLICRSQPAGAMAVGTTPNGKGDVPSEILHDPRVAGRLRERLSLAGSENGLLHDRVGDALLVDDLEAALDLHRRFPWSDYLTRSGDVVYASGVVQVAGRSAGDHGLLAHQRRTREARRALERARIDSRERQAESERRTSEVTAGEERLAGERAELERARGELLGAELLVSRATADHERAGQRSGVLADELEALALEAERLAERRIGLEAEVATAERRAQEIEAAQGLASDGAAAQELVAQRESESLTTLRETLAGLAQKLESAEQRKRSLAALAADLEGRRGAAVESAEAARLRGVQAADERTRRESELAEQVGSQSELGLRVARLETEIAELERASAAGEQEARAGREALDGLRERSREAELARTRAESAREHLDELCLQELGVRAGDALAAARAEGIDLDQVRLDELEAQVVDLRQQIERIGPVNMTAIEEFAELEQRHGFLTAQREDLERSMESLRETIRRLNRASRDRFAEAFEAIRAHYQEIYRLLFNGGRADLRLEEGEDMLECGVEILAQPPGKRLSSVQLLSGGEKALSAIALLFAIFRFQPSPFCLLDEVDAALDEANVGRFTRMLGEYARNTQFVIVTHNKMTMEAADLLYGVTMEEPGVSRVISLELGH
jgi:chromosome segregation protein